MTRIVVGLQQTDNARSAMAWASQFAVDVDGELLLISALGPGLPVLIPQIEQAKIERAAALEEWVAAGEPLEREHTTDFEFGDARQVLDDYCRHEHADLLVVGRQGSGGQPGLLHLGSVVEYLAHHVSVALAVIPLGAPATIQRIVVGVDGSPTSHDAVRWCADVALATGASVVAVQVHEPYLEWTWEADPDAWHTATEQAMRDDLAVELTRAGVIFDAVAMRGVRPADGLLKAVSDHNADLLVIGMRGLGGFSGLRAGGVAIDVLHQVGVPLVLVPPVSGS